MNDEFDEEKLFALHEKNTVKVMKIVVAVFVAAMLYSLYVFVFDD